jgi:hypothetical protein
VLAVFNATPTPRHNYRLGVPTAGRGRSSSTPTRGYGGSGVGNYGGVESVPVDSHGFHQSIVLTLPPLGAVFLAPDAGSVGDRRVGSAQPSSTVAPASRCGRPARRPSRSAIGVETSRPTTGHRDSPMTKSIRRREVGRCGTRHLVGRGRRTSARRSVPVPSTAGLAGRSGVALATRRCARSVGRRRRVAYRWHDDDWTGVESRRHGALRTAHRHVHRRGHVRRGDPAPAPAPRPRGHADRGDAGRSVPGDAQLGLRRRLPVRRAALLRRTRPVSPASSTPPTASGSASCSTSCTTTSGPKATCSGTVCAVLHRRLPHPVGRRGQRRRPGSDGVRRYFIENAVGWIRDFHLDGLRLDAVHAIVDPTPTRSSRS